jgi:hypothetical protein
MADSGITQLQMVDTVVGSGAEARPGRVVRVHYTGWLYDASKPDKQPLGSSDRRDFIAHVELHDLGAAPPARVRHLDLHDNGL